MGEALHRDNDRAGHESGKALDHQDAQQRHQAEKQMEKDILKNSDAGAIDKVKQIIRLETDRPHVLREAIRCIRKGGTFSIPGVYIGMVDMIPFGTAMNKGLTMKMGQTHVQRYTQKLLGMIQDGTIDPSFVITHTCTLDEGPEMYKTFRDKEDGCIKVVMKP